MRRLANSMVQFSWAMSIFGAQQLFDTLASSANAAGKARPVDGLRAVTQSVKDQLSDATQVIFRTGDALQHKTFGLMFPSEEPATRDADRLAEFLRESASLVFQGIQSLGSQPLPQPVSWGYTAAQASVSQVLLPPIARLIPLCIPGRDGRLSWTEFKNKFEVFELVQRPSSLLHIGNNVPRLSELVRRAYNLQPYPALWGLEGLGKYYADTFWQRDETPDQVLNPNKVGDLPSGSLPMLHAGIGLSFASHIFAPLQNDNRNIAAMQAALRHFLTLCRNNSRPGYQGAAIESLGLVLQELYPDLVLPVDSLLCSQDENAAAYFWHGVGRAIYFSPENFLPSHNASWRALKMCQQVAAPHKLAQTNCRAGLAWAVTLVNLRQPEIMQSLLQQQRDRLAGDDAFASGVAGALILRYDTTPDDSSLSAFCGHHVDAPTELAECWRRQVSDACRTGLHITYPRLKARHKLDHIFRYRSHASVTSEKEVA